VNPRWWRIVLVYEEHGDPWTWTFHVRAMSEKNARALVAKECGRKQFAVIVCSPSEPLPTAPREDLIVANYGPWRRSWGDSAIAPLRKLIAD
jgi:hypothetical protein